MVQIIEPQPEHPTLKVAGLNDIPRILPLAFKLFAESPYGDFQLDKGKVRQMLEKFIVEGSPNHLVLLSHDGPEIVGVLAAYAYEPLFSRQRVAIEVLWYLEPEFRASKRGLEMMDAYEFWAKRVGVSVVHYGVLATADDRQEKLYERRGLTPIEKTYQKVLD